MKRRNRPGNKDEVLAAVRAAIAAAGGKPMSMNKFFAASGMRSDDIYDHFSTWSDALRAAGLDMEPYNRRIDDGTLLVDWAAVTRQVQHVPSRSEYEKLGKYSATALRRRAGTWARLPDVFRVFAAGRHEWNDLLPLLPPPGVVSDPAAAATPCVVRKPAPLPNGRPICGELLEIGGMRNAPLNEMGVLSLFAILAERLDFRIEALQPGFPDCEAKRRVGSGAWQSARIEFEYESRTFRAHGHPPDGCDIIVCWVHNWPECPKNLEVIELSEEVRRFTLTRMEAE